MGLNHGRRISKTKEKQLKSTRNLLLESQEEYLFFFLMAAGLTIAWKSFIFQEEKTRMECVASCRSDMSLLASIGGEEEKEFIKENMLWVTLRWQLSYKLENNEGDIQMKICCT